MGTRHLSPFRGLLVGLVGELVTLDVLVRRDLVNRNTDSSEPKFVGFGYGHIGVVARRWWTRDGLDGRLAVGEDDHVGAVDLLCYLQSHLCP